MIGNCDHCKRGIFLNLLSVRFDNPDGTARAYELWCKSCRDAGGFA
jgi:hypothetical protein